MKTPASFALTASKRKISSKPTMENAAYQKLLTKGQIGLGVILTIGMFIYMSITLVPFTFSPDPFWAQAQACFAAVPIATTFWFAVNMFMIVLADQRKQKQRAK